jgi:hypothetical protein
VCARQNRTDIDDSTVGHQGRKLVDRERKKMFDAYWRLQIDMAHDHEAPQVLESVTSTVFKHIARCCLSEDMIISEIEMGALRAKKIWFLDEYPLFRKCSYARYSAWGEEVTSGDVNTATV